MTPLPCRLAASTKSSSEIETDWLIVGVPAEQSPTDPLTELDGKLGGVLGRLRAAGDLTGKHLELTPVLNATGLRARRLLLVGLGPLAESTRATHHDAFAAALRSITGRKFARIAVHVPSIPAHPWTALGAGIGALQGCFGPGVRKSEPSRFAPDELVLIGIDDRLLARVRAEGSALAFARELVNTPACDLYPETFAELAADSRLACEVWDERRLASERMGAILGVAGASSRPPRLVVLRYQSAGTGPTLALVGKGVTFDSGGLSLKTNEQMADMKGDMAGAAAVVAAMHAIAELGVRVNLLGVMPLVENMPGGRALKLGDVLRARNGKTIEVLNTDAEGRLILADALVYAAEQRPAHIVDLATLTGSCMIALGTEIAGLMTNNDAWGQRVRNAATRAGERAWPLPMDADFGDLLKSRVADLKNVPPSRYGGAIAGGKFLQQFVGDTPWVHLDIAGPAWAEHEAPARDPGGTGAFVRTLIELAVNYGDS
jgi:leucyl aminopeptidase